MQPLDLGRLVTPSGPRVSPDGAWVAFTVTRVDLDGDRYRRALWIVPADGSAAARPLTGGDADDASPAWSPDGRRLAFVRTAPGAADRLMVLPADGPGEAALLAERPTAITDLAWSPDGTAIAFTSRERRDDDRPTALPPGPEGSPEPRRIDRLLPTLDGAGSIVDRPRAVFVVGTDSPGAPRRLLRHRHDVGAPAWSPDGRTLAVCTVPDAPDADLAPFAALHLVDVDGEHAGELRALAAPTDCSVSEPAFSPAGDRIAALVENERIVPSFGRVAVVDVADGTLTVVSGGLDRQAAPFVGRRAPIWSGEDLLFAVEDHGDQPLHRVPADGSGDPAVVVGGTRAVVGYDEAAGTLALVSSTPTQRPELSVVRDGTETRLTTLQAAFHRAVPGGAPEHLRVPSPAGGEIDVWLLRPTDVPDDARLPVLLSVHGGPMTQYSTAWFDEFALWTGGGYAVVWCNPHGSTGDTEAFVRSIRSPEAADAPGSGWGGVDADDVLAALDAVLAHDPSLDPDRVGVLGGSYGGFMASWLAAHSDRFAAACSERSANNLLSLEWGGSDAAGYFRYEFGGISHLENPEMYRRMSPITYVHDIRTPMLLLHADEDLRCPPEQADQLYLALRLLGREVEYWRFPGEGHEMSRSGSPRHRVARAEIILEFFGRHLAP